MLYCVIKRIKRNVIVYKMKTILIIYNVKMLYVEVNQMMKVVGEEGTNTEDFVVYLKSEFLDFVYLQQNTFDAVDSASSRERQNYVFDKVTEVLKTDFAFAEKEEARQFFQELRVTFTEWNYMPYKEEKFNTQEKIIEAKIQEKAVHA